MGLWCTVLLGSSALSLKLSENKSLLTNEKSWIMVVMVEPFVQLPLGSFRMCNHRTTLFLETKTKEYDNLGTHNADSIVAIDYTLTSLMSLSIIEEFRAGKEAMEIPPKNPPSSVFSTIFYLSTSWHR